MMIVLIFGAGTDLEAECYELFKQSAAANMHVQLANCSNEPVLYVITIACRRGRQGRPDGAATR
jgi:hypothetical protein